MGGVTRLEKVQETRFCLKALLTSLMCVSDVSAADVPPCSPVLVCLCKCVGGCAVRVAKSEERAYVKAHS